MATWSDVKAALDNPLHAAAQDLPPEAVQRLRHAGLVTGGLLEGLIDLPSDEVMEIWKEVTKLLRDHAGLAIFKNIMGLMKTHMLSYRGVGVQG